jgi:hypothetical protein
MNSGILGNTAKGKKIAASIQSFNMGKVLKNQRDFVQEFETSTNNGDSKNALKKRGKLMPRQLFWSHIK